VTYSTREFAYIPSKGDRIERTRFGRTLGGTVEYADRLQVLVKWDNGRSSSLRADALGPGDLSLAVVPAVMWAALG
jgi:hypothetical protein